MASLVLTQRAAARPTLDDTNVSEPAIGAGQYARRPIPDRFIAHGELAAADRAASWPADPQPLAVLASVVVCSDSHLATETGSEIHSVSSIDLIGDSCRVADRRPRPHLIGTGA
jgi:hypothetical protein